MRARVLLALLAACDDGPKQAPIDTRPEWTFAFDSSPTWHSRDKMCAGGTGKQPPRDSLRCDAFVCTVYARELPPEYRHNLANGDTCIEGQYPCGDWTLRLLRPDLKDPNVDAMSTFPGIGDPDPESLERNIDHELTHPIESTGVCQVQFQGKARHR